MIDTPREKKDSAEDLERVDNKRFNRDFQELVNQAEDMRIHRMKQHRMRGFIAMNVSILSLLLGAVGAGWFFFMQAQLLPAVFCLIGSFIPAIFSQVWSGMPIKTYQKEYKTVFMPRLAKTLNAGLKFHPNRGVSSKILQKLAVIPAHDKYEAEDCFMGKYKGVKVLFSEARLYSKTNKDAPVFNGIFVLLEASKPIFEGHTILSANKKMVRAYSTTRWKTMDQIKVPVSNPDWDFFHIYSTKAEAAAKIIDERLIKELAEAAEIFDNAPLTAVLFGKKFIFMMIPHDQDMFEASDLFVPVTTRSQTMQCKKEIEQLLEIIDVFDLYHTENNE